MENKCPKCGFVYGEFDIYCAKCGKRLEKNIQLKKIIESKSEKDPSDVFVADDLIEDEFRFEKTKSDFSPRSKRNFFDGFILNFFLVLLIISLFLGAFLYNALEKQNAKKQLLQYRNLLNNPQQIPELKEPLGFNDLYENLSDVENFLMIYLKFSDDTNDKKERIFISYLNEMNKLSHITNENMVKDETDKCYKIKTPSLAKYCSARFNKEFKNIGIITYPEYNTIYLYPDYRYIYKKYSKYLPESMAEYMKLRARYYEPLTVGTTLFIKPKKLASKIYDFEKLYNLSDAYIKEDLEEQIYNNFRKFIFTPSIYNTTTLEMTNDFKYAYQYFINIYKKSALRPVVMSYFEKKRSYGEDNFKNDYPFKIYETTFDENVLNNAFADIFVELRKNIFSQNSDVNFKFVYNVSNAKWQKYQKNMVVAQGEYIFSEPDENNNIAVYNNTFSYIHDLNIPKNSMFFISNDGLYVYNSDYLNIHKIIFNGKMFILQHLNSSDVSSLFPGIKVINPDSYSNYNIYLEKDNQKASYIILSKYSRGFANYNLTPIKGKINYLFLPNMFSVSSNEDIVISFHDKSVNAESTSETLPTYRLIIHTRGEESDIDNSVNEIIHYDPKTASEENTDDKFIPNIMPKINSKAQEEDFTLPPMQQIVPPDDSE